MTVVRAVVKALEKAGWVMIRQKGSHVFIRKMEKLALYPFIKEILQRVH